MTAPTTLFNTGRKHDPEPVPTGPFSGLFADIVFDRPLDTRVHLRRARPTSSARSASASASRPPSARAARPPPGSASASPTSRRPPVRGQARLKVLDDDALVDDHLMKLTRWMADYYLCGWGQVLHAVVPGRGARQRRHPQSPRSSSRCRRRSCPNPLPTVTPQQKAALDKLKKEGRPLEILQLARLAKCTPGVVAGLVKKGLRAEVQRAHREPKPRRPAASELEDEPSPRRRAIELNADQRRVWDRSRPALDGRRVHAVPAARRHRQRQDRDLSPGHRGGRASRGRKRSSSSRKSRSRRRRIARFQGPVRERRGAAQPPHRRRARRLLAARRRRARSGRRRRPQRRLRPDAQARPHRHRRGAREHLQAGIDAALPRPRRGRDAGAARRHPDPDGLRDAEPRKLGERRSAATTRC